MLFAADDEEEAARNSGVKNRRAERLKKVVGDEVRLK
jgi:hypothetical protein